MLAAPTLALISREGVRVAVYCTEPSARIVAWDRSPNEALVTIKSSLVKPKTGSLKRMVRVDDSPAPSCLSLKLKVAVGGF